MEKVTNQPSIAPEESKQVVDVQLGELTRMLNDPKCEFRNILSQVYKVMMALHRIGCRENKVYALDKELHMQVEVQNVKGTYNGIASLTITIISGGLTILGGAVGVFGAFPGTVAGNGIASIAPKALGFFAKAESAQRISNVGQGISSGGQGTGIFAKIFDNKQEAQRAVYQFALNAQQRRHDDSSRAGTEESQLSRDAIKKAEQVEYEAHSTASRVLGDRT